MKLEKGYTVSGKYNIKHYINNTSFCEIYSAKDLESSKLISLYVYNASNISSDDLDSENNLKEIGFLGLGVEGFPKLIGFGNFNNSNERYRYVATEFIVGESVMDRMKRNGPLSEIDSVLVSLKLIEIADKLHSREKSILLNALSLDNIMFDMSENTEKIKLRNLINVRYFEDEFKYNYIDGVMPNYLAPECFKNVFTAKSDQYNIGALLYHMIAGLVPWFSEPQDHEINTKSIEKLEKKQMVPLKFSDIFDEHLKSVINKSLNFNADERFISLTNFSTYLNRDTLLSDNTSYGVAPKKNIKIKKTGNGFSDVAGMDDLKKLLQTKFIDTLKRPDHAKKYGLTIPNGMLLYGPPGCGKTFIAKKFGEEASYNFILVKPSDLSSIYVSGGEQKIGQLFDEAEKNAPSIICFDEVDAVMPNRSSGDNSQAIGSRVNEYLAQIDKCSERGIFCIGTTNRPNLIDAAVLRTGRLEHKIYVGPPDIEAREKMFELYLKNRHIEFDIDYQKFANLTKGIVASDIEFIVNQASHKCAMLDIRISNKVIIDVISSFTPSVPKNEIDRYEEEFNDNNKKSTSNNNHVMGFKKDRK